MLKVVLDTNILLSSLSRKSSYRFILEAIFENKYELYVSTEILLEYEEKITTIFDAQVAETLISALLIRDNVKKIDTYFDLYLIKNDIDDNKFINCAFAGNVNALVSNDKHFNILKTISFPKITLLSINEFLELISW
jgi:putative PIN family toxin of toxin-antitoxin system